MGIITQRFIPGPRLIDGNDLNNLVDQANSGLGAGVTYYVNSTIGNDGVSNNGLNPFFPLATINRAIVLETAALLAKSLSTVGRGSVIAFWGTVRLTDTLVWALPGTTLLGLCAPLRRGKRARISSTGSTAFSPMISVTGAGNQFANFGTFYGFDSASNNAICWQDTGGRNCYDNVEFLGFGNNTASTGTANITGARALKMSGSTGESTFVDCVFGVDTTDRNATNYTLEIAGGSPRNYFQNCDFEARLGSSGTAASHVLIGSGGIDRYVNFVQCRFHNFSSNAMAQCLNVNASAGGAVCLDQCTINYLITAWSTASVTLVQINMTAPGSGGGKAITAA